jgi:cysteine desulfuration protein SufE
MDIEELIFRFECFDDWQERYRYLIDLGRKLPAMDPADKIEANRVLGCVSQVWVVEEVSQDEPPIYSFIADSDSHIVKGLIAIVQVVFSGKTRDEIAKANIDEVFRQIGLDEHLSPNRRNGFFSMVERIRRLSKASQAAS